MWGQKFYKGDFMGKKLNERQKRAADYFIELGNKRQALIKAGYSPYNTAVFKNDSVKEYVEKRIKLLDEKRIASASEVMKYLTAVMRGEEKEQVVVLESEGDGITAAKNVEKEISAKDRIKAAELLGKRFGIYTDKLNINQGVSIVIQEDLQQ